METNLFKENTCNVLTQAIIPINKTNACFQECHNDKGTDNYDTVGSGYKMLLIPWKL